MRMIYLYQFEIGKKGIVFEILLIAPTNNTTPFN